MEPRESTFSIPSGALTMFAEIDGEQREFTFKEAELSLVRPEGKPAGIMTVRPLSTSEPCSLEFVIDEFRPYVRKISRKRFIKLMMSIGFSRNDACELAEDCNTNDIPYAYEWWKWDICCSVH